MALFLRVLEQAHCTTRSKSALVRNDYGNASLWLGCRWLGTVREEFSNSNAGIKATHLIGYCRGPSH